MSFQSLNIGIVLTTILTLNATGCSSTSWRKQQTVVQEAKHAYVAQDAARIRYDDSTSESAQYQMQPVSDSTYAPVPPVSRNQSGGSGSCCH